MYDGRENSLEGNMSVRIGYMPGAFPTGKEGVQFFRGLVEVGDKYGYDSIWLSDRVVGERASVEPMVALSMVAAYSDKLKFGTSVLQLPIRSPVVLAKEMATLDYLSNGRLLPAIGLGQEDPREYEACGVSKEDRGRRSDEAMVVIRRLWQEDNVTHEGQFYTLHDVTVNPKPVQVPFLPIWIGGRSTAAQKRVGRTGDGWLVSSATAREVQEGITVIFDTAAEFGREIEEDHMGALISYYIAPTHEEAAQVAETYTTRPRPDAHFTEYSALGTPEQVKETIHNYLEAGASKFVVRPMCPPQQALEQLELFGNEVLPQFHK
jgi:probable F420-dependent oxidoreductase